MDSFGIVRSPSGESGRLHGKDVGAGGWCFFKAFADQVCSQTVPDFRVFAVLALVQVARKRRVLAPAVVGVTDEHAEALELLEARAALRHVPAYAGVVDALGPFDCHVLDKFEGVIGGDMNFPRRYADEFEMLALLAPLGLELLIVEGADSPTALARDQRSRLHPRGASLADALPLLRRGEVDLVFVRLDVPGFQHYESVCFIDGTPWCLGDDARQRVEAWHAACDVCGACRRGRFSEARAMLLSILEAEGAAGGAAL